jgi:hypothetical protein
MRRIDSMGLLHTSVDPSAWMALQALCSKEKPADFAAVSWS